MSEISQGIIQARLTPASRKLLLLHGTHRSPADTHMVNSNQQTSQLKVPTASLQANVYQHVTVYIFWLACPRNGLYIARSRDFFEVLDSFVIGLIEMYTQAQ